MFILNPNIFSTKIKCNKTCSKLLQQKGYQCFNSDGRYDYYPYTEEIVEVLQEGSFLTKLFGEWGVESNG